MKQYIRRYGLLSLLLAIPLYWSALYYIEVMSSQEREEIAFVATLTFFVCVFTGRYIAIVWLELGNQVPNRIFTIMGFFIAGDVLWLFIHADFQLSHFPAINLFLFWIPYLLLATTIGIATKFFRINLSTLNEAKASAAHNKAELSLLQSQLSPHFLFNTLNNMYGISITKHEKVPALLLKLSELLRYSVYEAGELYVPLTNELTYISNYIEFEQLRIGDRLVLHTMLENVEHEKVKVAPMLLMVFIENAFKHAKNSTDQKIYVAISLKTDGNNIYFDVRNSLQIIYPRETGKEFSGFGLENARKRLELLYPAAHKLQIEEKDGFYNVHLELKIKQE